MDLITYLTDRGLRPVESSTSDEKVLEIGRRGGPLERVYPTLRQGVAEHWTNEEESPQA